MASCWLVLSSRLPSARPRQSCPPPRHRSEGGATSAEIRARVEQARAIQRARGYYNAHIPVRLLRKLCLLDEAGERTLEMAVRRRSLSARAHDRILKAARVIAGLTGAEATSAYAPAG